MSKVIQGVRGADVFNTFYAIPCPEEAPLRAGLQEMYRFRTWPVCRKCGQSFPREAPLYYESPKWETTPSNLKVLRPAPRLTDAEVMEFLMVRACNLGVGCWRECRCGKNWNMKCLSNCVARGVRDEQGYLARPGDCPCICSCNPGCGNRKQYPCRCGHVALFHRSGCPVGLFKRDASFLLPWKRKHLVKKGQERERALRGL